jgi:hypothetical protein
MDWGQALSMRRKKKLAQNDQAMDGPAIITNLHRQDRAVSKVAGASRAWRKLSHLQAAYWQERLGPKDSGTARDRLASGNFYTELWDGCQRGSRDSTDRFEIGRQSQGEAMSEAQRCVLSRLVAIERALGERDRIIVRAVCGMGHSPSDAIALAKVPKDTRVSARLCEALDALGDAIMRTRKNGRG